MNRYGDHELLIRHFQGWAAGKRRQPDLELLSVLLDLHTTYAGLSATAWPAGAVEDLLVEWWPAKGPVDVPDEHVVIETLDSFVRFLRGTGRMAARSAEPAALKKEARRGTARMGALAGDRVEWSFTKQLMAFGVDQGIRFDDAPDSATLQRRLAQTVALWNALPQEERLRLSPRPGEDHEPPGPESDLSGREVAKQLFDHDDPVLALISTFAGRLPDGELPPVARSAAYVRDSAYAQQMWALARWVGDGKEITANRVLRPAPAREAYAVLGLGDWQRTQLERAYPDERLPGVARVGREAWIADHLARPWRSAANCDELHRLWLGAAGCGSIVLHGKQAAYSGEGEPDDERWLESGVRAMLALLNNLAASRPSDAACLAWALLSSYVSGCGPVGHSAVVEFSLAWTYSPGLRADMASFDLTQYEEPHVAESLGLLADTGMYVDDGSTLRLTEFGDVVVTAWLDFLRESGLLG